MKNFIKNNWFKMGIILALFLIGASFIYSFFLGNSINYKQQDSIKELSTENLELNKNNEDSDPKENILVEQEGKVNKKNEGNDVQEREFYKNKSAKIVNLYNEMCKMILKYVENTVFVTESRLNGLDTLITNNERLNLQNSYYNQLLLADRDYVLAINDLFKRYSLVFQGVIDINDKYLNEAKNSKLEKKEMYLSIIDVTIANIEDINEDFREIQEKTNSYLLNENNANKKYETILGYGVDYLKIQEVQILEDIADNLEQLRFDLKYNY